MAASAEVLVLGAGVVGASIAFELARGGRQVFVLDRSPSPGTGSTSASSAIVRFNYSTIVGVALARESYHLWRRWEEHIGTIEGPYARFHRIGGLTIDSPDQDLMSICELYDAVGVPYEWWNSEDIRDRLPGIDDGDYHPPRAVADPTFWDDAQTQIRGVWTPDAGFIDDPQLATRNLMQAAIREGAQMVARAEVTRIGRDEGSLELTCADGRTFRAPIVINAAGPHSETVNAMAGVGAEFTLRTRPMRQEVHELRAPDPYSTERRLPLIVDPGLGIYLRGTLNGGIMVGGLEPRCDPYEWLDDPDVFNPRPTSERFEAQTLRATRRMPDLRIENHPRGIAGVYDVAEDWTPIYDRTNLEGFYVAIGTSGNQFKNAPLIGKIMQTVIDHGADVADPAAEAHLRLDEVDMSVSLAQFGRARPIDRMSAPFSVLG